MAITCQCPQKCEIHPKYPDDRRPTINALPQIDAADKLTLKVLEAESLKYQLEAQRTQQQLIQRVQLAHQQLEQFSAAMFEKAGLRQGEWMLDLSKLEFIRRPEPPSKG